MTMKDWSSIFVFLFLLNTSLFGQNCVSGYVKLQDPKQGKQKVYLSQIQLEENTSRYTTTTVASTLLSEDGFFAFDQNLFTSKNHIYKIQLGPILSEEKNKLYNKVKDFRLFILSKKDTIHFTKGEMIFGEYTTNNIADLEWRKLKKFEAKYENLTDNFNPKQYLIETKGYVKDSLQILLVKLIGIKKLDDQNLLEKDAKANPEYYISFLKELKSSELDPSTYAYLENKLNFITQEIVNQKYQVSLWINGIAFFVIVLLLLITIKSWKKLKTAKAIPLSKQEKAVKNLIISGKSNKEIANELFISLSTVKTHITNIYSKLNISSRQDLLLKK